MKKLNTIKSAEEYGETTNERAAESLKVLTNLGSHISAQMKKSRKSASKESPKQLRRKKSKSKKQSMISSKKATKKLLSSHQLDVPSSRGYDDQVRSSKRRAKASIRSSSFGGSRLPPPSSSKHHPLSVLSKGNQMI